MLLVPVSRTVCGRAVARSGVSALREQGVLEIVDRPAELGKLVGGQRDRC